MTHSAPSHTWYWIATGILGAVLVLLILRGLRMALEILEKRDAIRRARKQEQTNKQARPQPRHHKEDEI